MSQSLKILTDQKLIEMQAGWRLSEASAVLFSDHESSLPRCKRSVRIFEVFVSSSEPKLES